MKAGLLKLLPVIFGLHAQGKIASTENQPIIPERSYGAYGYTGFIGTNADRKKHFNKKRHGRMLRRKHAKYI